MNTIATKTAICPACGHDALAITECLFGPSSILLKVCDECGWESKPLQKAREYSRYISQAASDYARSKAR